jgi:hypothetical protein
MPTPRGPFRPIPLTAQVAVAGANATDNRPVVLVLHALTSGAPTVANMTDIADAVADTFEANLAAWPTDVKFSTVTATDLNSSSGPQSVVAVAGAPLAGTATPDLPGATFVTEFMTAKRGRSFTGRVMMPANADSLDHPTGIISGAGITLQQNFFQAIATALIALTPASTLVVASRKLQVSTVVTSIVTRPKAGNLRRRFFG